MDMAVVEKYHSLVKGLTPSWAEGVINHDNVSVKGHAWVLNQQWIQTQLLFCQAIIWNWMKQDILTANQPLNDKANKMTYVPG